jgi:hypothetical protein
MAFVRHRWERVMDHLVSHHPIFLEVSITG